MLKSSTLSQLENTTCYFIRFTGSVRLSHINQFIKHTVVTLAEHLGAFKSTCSSPTSRLLFNDRYYNNRFTIHFFWLNKFPTCDCVLTYMLRSYPKPSITVVSCTPPVLFLFQYSHRRRPQCNAPLRHGVRCKSDFPPIGNVQDNYQHPGQLVTSQHKIASLEVKNNRCLQ